MMSLPVLCRLHLYHFLGRGGEVSREIDSMISQPDSALVAHGLEVACTMKFLNAQRSLPQQGTDNSAIDLLYAAGSGACTMDSLECGIYSEFHNPF